MTEFEHNFDWLVGEIDKVKEQARVLFSKCIAKVETKLDATKAAVAEIGGLVTPSEAPAAHKLVGIDTTNGQELISIGDGLTLENGELKASGAPATPIVITFDESNNTYTLTGSTLATLQTDFETKTVLVKSLFAYPGDTSKVTSIGYDDDGKKVRYSYANQNLITTATLKPDGTYTETYIS